jgi:hypothetical protein
MMLNPPIGTEPGRFFAPVLSLGLEHVYRLGHIRLEIVPSQSSINHFGLVRLLVPCAFLLCYPVNHPRNVGVN